jgi:uncharacterized protein (TIGR02757 family)
MVRSDRVDPGVWRRIPASKLIVPLDTHMFRFARAFGLTARRQPSLAAAREITAAFRNYAPLDPVKYDFAITRLGIRRDADRIDILERFDRAAAARHGSRRSTVPTAGK